MKRIRCKRDSIELETVLPIGFVASKNPPVPSILLNDVVERSLGKGVLTAFGHHALEKPKRVATASTCVSSISVNSLVRRQPSLPVSMRRLANPYRQVLPHPELRCPPRSGIRADPLYYGIAAGNQVHFFELS